MNPEDQVQIDILRWIHRHAPGVLVFHPPNGGGRSQREGVRLQKLGVLAGVSDLIVVPPGGIIHVLEVKANGGRPTPAQTAFMRRIADLGGQARLVRTVGEVSDAFYEWEIATT